jgi:hypothetical protein
LTWFQKLEKEEDVGEKEKAREREREGLRASSLNVWKKTFSVTGS